MPASSGIFYRSFQEDIMWKMFGGFIVFALIALFVIMKGGDKIDMQGETSSHSPSGSSSAPAASAPSK
jgi:hypothetical protein